MDNGSTDETTDLLEQFERSATLPVRVLKNATNVGPAAARNQAARVAGGTILAFVDNDAKPAPDWLSEGMKIFEDKEVGIVQCKLLLNKDGNILDSVGSYLGKFGFLVHRTAPGIVADLGQFDHFTAVFSTKSAGMLIRRSVFVEIGEFDPDYFIYNEEMDLCWRAWLSGHKVMFAPSSVVYHEWGTTRKVDSTLAERLLYFHGPKNYLLTVLKDSDEDALIPSFLVQLAIWIGISFYVAAKRKPLASLYILAGVAWNLRWLKRSQLKRARVLRKAKVPDNVVRRVPLGYYLRVLRRY